MQERFKDLTIEREGAKVTLQIGNEGTICRENVELVQKSDKAGYKLVWIKPFKANLSVHRLVAKAWLNKNLSLSGKRVLGGNNIDVCHLNGNRQDNRVANLVIADHATNCRMANSRMNYTNANRRFKQGRNTVTMIDRDGNKRTFNNWYQIADFLNMKEANVRANIQLNIKGRTKHAYGYQWTEDRDNTYIKGSKTKYYKRTDGTRPNFKKED